MSNYTITKLKNGLTLLIVPLSGSTSVAALALVGVGSRYENEKTQGLAHFYEHLSVMGTEKYPTNFDFTHKIEAVGADFNAFTGEEYTGYYIKTENRHLPMALDMLSQLLIHPLLKQSEIERERLVILEEIKMREDTPQIKVADRMVELLFSGSGLGLPGTGIPETVTSFNRTDFLELKKLHYVGSNIVLVIAGKVSPPSLLKREGGGSSTKQPFKHLTALVSEIFSDLPSGTSTEPEPFIESSKGNGDDAGLGKVYRQRDVTVTNSPNGLPHLNANPNPTLEIIKKQTDQVHLCLGFRGYSRKDPQRYAQSLLSVILGSGFTSRLFQKVRQQKSLAYSIDSDSDLFSDTGLFAVQAGVDQNRLQEAIQTIWEELHAVKGRALHSSARPGLSVTRKELRKAKDYLRGKLVLRLEDPLNLAMYYGGQQLLDHKILTWEQVLSEVEAVTISDIEQAAAYIFNPTKMSLVLIGNHKLKLAGKKLQSWLS